MGFNRSMAMSLERSGEGGFWRVGLAWWRGGRIAKWVLKRCWTALRGFGIGIRRASGCAGLGLLSE